MLNPDLPFAVIQGTPDIFTGILEAAAEVSTPIRLLAFAIAAVLILALILMQRRGKTPPILWGALVLVGFLAVIPLFADAILARGSQRDAAGAIYRLRVTVLGSNGMPAKPDSIWSSWGGEPQAVAAGWMFVIPRATIPRSGAVAVYASREAMCEYGMVEQKLGEDPNPEVALRLRQDTSAEVGGTVRDEANQAVAGAQVFVEGYGDREVDTTNAVGAFRLPAHATPCEQVRVSAEKPGYEPTAEYVYPGGTHASLTLVRRKP